MSAARLRRVGNLGTLVDPAAVVAVGATDKPPGVRVVLEHGVALIVFRPELVDGRGHDVTTEDVDKVRAQLTERREEVPRAPRS